MRSQRIQSFAAHESNTNCLMLGQKSGRVLVTGGQDKTVNLWTIDNPERIISLSSHITPITAVSLDWPEEIVVAGCQGGSLKLWDLEQAQLIRTLSGHRSSIHSLDFHPFGEFFASGSADRTVKVWDIRKKGCIQTYSGHTDSIKQLKITPDGRWLASGGNDGRIKLWDLTAGKLIDTLADQISPIISLTYNPCEFVIAAAFADKWIRIYDLTSFELISEVQSAVRIENLIFSRDGILLYASSSTSLQVFEWEGMEVVREVAIGWKGFQDCGILPDAERLIACAINGNYVDTWAVQLNEVSLNFKEGVHPNF